MNSPITGRPMILLIELRTLPFRKEDFEVMYHFFRDEESGEDFTTGDQMDLNLNQVYNQYREKYNLPFPEEISKIREKYDLSAAKMSEILGFGANQYRNYEMGEVPNESNSRLIQMAKDPNKFRQLVELNTGLEEGNKIKLLKKTDEIIKNEKEHKNVIDFSNFFSRSSKPDKFSGYRSTDFEKLSEMVVFFTEVLMPWKTQLNKLLFYADFAYYRLAGKSISGTRYRAIDLGPVPSNYDILYENLESKQIIKIKRTESADGSLKEEFLPFPGRKFNKELLNENELNTLKQVVDRFGSIKAGELSAISHDEPAWIGNQKDHELIDYKYSFELKNL